MSAARDRLQEIFALLLGWERRKRREGALVSIACTAVTLALVLVPFHVYSPIPALRWFMPLLFVIGIAPWFFHRRRWRHRDATQALVKLDKTLNSAERATTAWDLAGRAERDAAAELVYKQAHERLSAVDVRGLFPRSWGWQGYALLPLILAWCGLLWFDIDQTFFVQQSSVPSALARQLRQFSQELQEKAKSEGLPESFKAGQELEKMARKNIEAKTGDDQFREEVAGVAKDIAAANQARAGDPSTVSGESQQGLQDLRAELGAARDLLNLPDAVDGRQELPKSWMDRLASLPQLRRQLDKAPQSGQGFGRQELKSFLDRLDDQATHELDRRALLDAQKFLEQMMQSGRGNRREGDMRTAGQGERESAGEGTREDHRSNLPGKEPGKTEHGYNSLPEFRGGAQTQVKGSLGDGDSSGVGFKGNPTASKSRLEQQEVVANYRRQAEQELNSERVPAALKTTIRNYFLSLAGEEERLRVVPNN